ncbi:unnamed protein product, partial [Meganyctiphanes norvegica]
MHQALKNTGLTQWDSTLPFNLANIRECRAIRDVLHRAYDSDGITVSENNTTLHRRKKRRDPAMIIQGLDIHDKSVGQRKQEDNNISIEKNNGLTVKAIEKTIRDRVLKEKLQTNRMRIKDERNAMKNGMAINKSLEKKKRKNADLKESVNASYENNFNKSLYNSLSIINKEELTKNKNSSNEHKIYQKYIDYILSVVKQMPLKDLQSLYDSSFLKCKDALHTSEMSIQDEIHMIYNLLCNQYESKQSDLCCQ